MRLFIRRQICLTLLKKRKRNINNKCDSYIEKSFYSNNNYIEENKNKFTNISLENNVNNFFIKSINKAKKYDFSVSHFKIICNKNHHLFEQKKLTYNNYINFSILIDKNIINYKQEIEKYKKLVENYKSITQSNQKMKLELNEKNENIESKEKFIQNNKIEIEALNKKIKLLTDQLNNLKYENNKYKEFNNKKISYYISKSNFNIINKKYILFKLNKFNFYYIPDSSKKINCNFNNLIISNSINYNLLSLINKKIKKDLTIINLDKIFFHGKTQPQKEILLNFESELKNIERKNNLFKLLIFSLKLNNYTLHHKFFFLLRLVHYSYKAKLKYTFDSLKNILIIVKLKHIIKNIPSIKKKYFFYKYYKKALSFTLSENKEEISKCIHKNTELEKNLNLFTDTFKKYEQAHNQEDLKQKNELSKYKDTIKDLNSELEKIKKSAKETTEELINTNNECNNQKKIINGLNEEINELKASNNILENKILSQQELIKNINSKMQKYQDENEENEQKYNLQIDQVQSKFDEYKNNIDELNDNNNLLIKENDKLKITVENLNKSNEKMFEIIKNSKNFEIENENLKNKNNQLMNDNETINNKYRGLKEDFDNLKLLSEESKNELTKAIHEMELYSQLLQTLENKVTIAENDKKKAINERDKAINYAKMLKQRYINIIGNEFD